MPEPQKSCKGIPVERCHPSRLTKECQVRGLPCWGTKEDRIEELKGVGVDVVYPDLPVVPLEDLNKKERLETDPSSVQLGAPSTKCGRNRFTLCNPYTKDAPLLSGHFRSRSVTVDRALHLVSSDDLQPNTPGKEGELRRKGSDLFLYRKVGTRKGWYRISFDYLYV